MFFLTANALTCTLTPLELVNVRIFPSVPFCAELPVSVKVPGTHVPGVGVGVGVGDPPGVGVGVAVGVGVGVGVGLGLLDAELVLACWLAFA